jgi:predicted acylesterase/phospholipase RssA
MLNNIFKDIKNNYPNNLSKNNIKIDIMNEVPYNFLLEHFDSKYVFSKIITYIKNCKKYIIISYNNIRFHIFYIKDNDIIIQHLIKSIMRAYTLTKINNYSHITFNIYILMSHYKRFIPKKGIINTEHINGGFTSLTNDLNRQIFISRKEEYSKVILHEIIHHFKDINNENWDSGNILKLKKHFKISSTTNLNPNEAFVELWATIYHILFISYEYKINYKLLLKKEINNSLSQSYKLLLFNKNAYWQEKTNSYCYIIFKTILLYNFNKLSKIYAFPYDISSMTKFLIKYSKLPSYCDNIKNNSLRMMILSDH